MTDYQALLKKYMQHVCDCEGWSFLQHLNSHMHSDVVFTDDEVRILEEIDRERYDEGLTPMATKFTRKPLTPPEGM